MANSSKSKGDKAEREAVLVLNDLASDLTVSRPRRKLGAGRKDDEGDLDVFPDATVQVKFWPAAVNASVREAAIDAQAQSSRAGTPFHTGMVCLPNVRTQAVRWVAATLEWPGFRPTDDELALFALVPKALAHIRREDIGVPRRRRIALVRYADTPDIFVAPIDAWLLAYRRARAAALAA
ncbi:MAG: hypothetical protein M3Y35_16655 [Actinomycetota bacterium]|nr:hypothetical protein [Actinomycetota bacterium]